MTGSLPPLLDDDDTDEADGPTLIPTQTMEARVPLLPPAEIQALAERTMRKTAQDVIYDAQEEYEDGNITGDEFDGWIKRALKTVAKGAAGIVDAWADLSGAAEEASDLAIYGGADKIVDLLIPGAGRLRLFAEAQFHGTPEKALRAAERKRAKIPAALAEGNTKKAAKLEEKATKKDELAAKRAANV